MKRLRPWSKMGVLFFVGLVFAIGQFKIPPMLTEIMEDLGIGLACSGLLMTVVAITAIFLAFLGGLLTVRFHPKKLGIAAICFGFVGNAIGFFASTFWVLLASRLIEGLGYGIIGTIGPTLISYWFPEEKRNKPMALWTLWVPIGMLIAFNGANAVCSQLVGGACGLCATSSSSLPWLFFVCCLMNRGRIAVLRRGGLCVTRSRPFPSS